jgi:tRNA nucleotidyltransferase (CCA-adding enzyme)
MDEKLKERVLKKIVPTKKEIEREKKIVKELLKKIDSIKGKHVKTILAGSMARNTHLRGDNDIDIFVLFPTKIERNEFVREGLKIGKKVLKGFEWEEAFSEHPYIRGKYKGFNVEIVPSYEIKTTDKLLSSVDRTPFHTKYLIEHLKENQKNEVRLLKQFLKGIECYGADLKTESFPGYITELLVLKYGSFENVLKNVQNWRKGEVIDLENYYTESEARKKFNHHLIIVDPIDKKRNVAFALSFNQFARFIAASRRFIEKPSEKFFFGKKIKPWSKKKVMKMLEQKEIIIVKMPFPKKQLSDIMWGQLKKLRKKIVKELKLKEFRVNRAKEWTDEKKLMIIAIDLENVKIQKVHLRIGPEVMDLKNSERFLNTHKKIIAGPRIENGRWVIEVKRKHWNAKTLLQDYLKEQKKVLKKGIKKALEKAQVLGEKQAIKLYSKNNEFQEFFTKFLKGKEEFLEY